MNVYLLRHLYNTVITVDDVKYIIRCYLTPIITCNKYATVLAETARYIGENRKANCDKREGLCRGCPSLNYEACEV